MAEVERARSLYNFSPAGSDCSTTLSMADRLETMYSSNTSPPLVAADCPPPKKRKVNFSLTLDIKQESTPASAANVTPIGSDDACVPLGPSAAAVAADTAHSDAESYYSDLPAMPTTPHGGPQVPPLTPGTNLKVGEALKATYASWNEKTRSLGIPRDPRVWENIEVIAWLDWATNEFQLYSDTVISFISGFKVVKRDCYLYKVLIFLSFIYLYNIYICIMIYSVFMLC